MVKQARHPFEEVRRILCYRLDPAEGAALFPVSVPGLSYFFLLHKIDIPGDDCPVSLTCTRSLLQLSLTNDRRAPHLGHIRPVSRQSGSDLSSSLLHHNNIFPSLPWPASSLLISGIAFCLSPCYSLLFLSKVKMYFPQCKRLKLKFRIQRRCEMML